MSEEFRATDTRLRWWIVLEAETADSLTESLVPTRVFRPVKAQTS